MKFKELLQVLGDNYDVDICVCDKDTAEHILTSQSLTSILQYGNAMQKSLLDLKVASYQPKFYDLVVLQDKKRTEDEATEFYGI